MRTWEEFEKAVRKILTEDFEDLHVEAKFYPEENFVRIIVTPNQVFAYEINKYEGKWSIGEYKGTVYNLNIVSDTDGIESFQECFDIIFEDIVEKLTIIEEENNFKNNE